jgi:TolB-like protein
MSSEYKDESVNDESIIEIHSIAVASFNILSRQKNVKIFVVLMKNLEIQLKKQDSKTVIDFKSVIFSKYHDFLNVFFQRKS